MALVLAFGAGAAFTSCVDTDSSLVDFNPQLNSPNDTVYSLFGNYEQDAGDSRSHNYSR